MDDIIIVRAPSLILQCKCGKTKIYIQPEDESHLGPMPRCRYCNTVTSIPDMSPTTAKGLEESAFDLPPEHDEKLKELETKSKRKRQEASGQKKKVENYSEEEALWQARLNDQPNIPEAKKKPAR